jgi:predicted metal-dependent hydrolase
VRFSSEIIEYVIMHELAHLKHRAHDAKFYALLEKLCPEWKSFKSRLSTVYLE